MPILCRATCPCQYAALDPPGVVAGKRRPADRARLAAWEQSGRSTDKPKPPGESSALVIARSLLTDRTRILPGIEPGDRRIAAIVPHGSDTRGLALIRRFRPLPPRSGLAHFREQDHAVASRVSPAAHVIGNASVVTRAMSGAVLDVEGRRRWRVLGLMMRPRGRRRPVVPHDGHPAGQSSLSRTKLPMPFTVVT